MEFAVDSGLERDVVSALAAAGRGRERAADTAAY
jgi:hypothetical protein